MATVNGKHYVGQTEFYQRRQEEHRKATDDSHFHRAIRLHGVVTFRVLVDDVPKSALHTHERFWIRFYDTFHSGYNMTEGGDTNPMDFAENRKKVSDAIREAVARGEHNMQDPEAREHLSTLMREKAAIGEHQAQQPETRAKYSATAQRKLADGTHSTQDPERNANISKTLCALGERGEHPAQQPQSRAKNRDSNRKTSANKLLKERRDSGQSYMVEMEVYDGYRSNRR